MMTDVGDDERRGDVAYWWAQAAAAKERARHLEWKSDPVLRQRTRDILALPLIERLRLIEKEAELYGDEK